jgi:hypothetical protein
LIGRIHSVAVDNAVANCRDAVRPNRTKNPPTISVKL